MSRKSPRSGSACGRECVHYWVCGPVIEATSVGVCQHCGAKKEFSNYLIANPEPKPRSPRRSPRRKKWITASTDTS